VSVAVSAAASLRSSPMSSPRKVQGWEVDMGIDEFPHSVRPLARVAAHLPGEAFHPRSRNLLFVVLIRHCSTLPFIVIHSGAVDCPLGTLG
jgi:hypothetical protein